jgi:hypothetical protein
VDPMVVGPLYTIYINKMQDIKRVETKMLKMNGVNIFVPPR